MDMSYIMDSGSNRLYTTFPNIFSLISADPADLSKNQKNHFSKKLTVFLIENLLQRVEIWFNRDSTLVPSSHQHSHKPTNLIFGFWNIKFLLTFCLTMWLQVVKQNVSKHGRAGGPGFFSQYPSGDEGIRPKTYNIQF